MSSAQRAHQDQLGRHRNRRCRSSGRPAVNRARDKLRLAADLHCKETVDLAGNGDRHV